VSKCQAEVRTDLPPDPQREMARLSLGRDYLGVLTVGEKQGVTPRDVKAISCHRELPASVPSLRARDRSRSRRFVASAIVGHLTCSGREEPAVEQASHQAAHTKDSKAQGE